MRTSALLRAPSDCPLKTDLSPRPCRSSLRRCHFPLPSRPNCTHLRLVFFYRSVFIFLGIERFGRRKALGFGGAGMSLFLFIIGAIFATHPPKIAKAGEVHTPSHAS